MSITLLTQYHVSFLFIFPPFYCTYPSSTSQFVFYTIRALSASIRPLRHVVYTGVEEIRETGHRRTVAVMFPVYDPVLHAPVLHIPGAAIVHGWRGAHIRKRRRTVLPAEL